MPTFHSEEVNVKLELKKKFNKMIKDGGLETRPGLVSRKAGLGLERENLGLGLMLSRAQSRSKQSAEITETSKILT